MSTVSGTAVPLSHSPTWFTALVSSYFASGRREAAPPKPTALVIDDEGPIRELLSLYLDGEGLEVATVRSADGAKALVQHGQFDVVILDWMLEGVDGRELLHLWKAQHPDIPVIIFSGADLDEGGNGDRFPREADAVVRKGGPLEALSTAIFRSLERRKAQPSNAA